MPDRDKGADKGAGGDKGVGECVLKFGRTATGYLVRVEGRGTMRESLALQQFVMRCALAENLPVVVDLSATHYLDSTFLGCLVSLHRRCCRDAQSAHFTIAVSEQAKCKLLRPTRVDLVLTCIEACPEPVGDLVAITTLQIESRTFGRHVMQSHRQLAELGGADANAFADIAEQIARELRGSEPRPE